MAKKEPEKTKTTPNSKGSQDKPEASADLKIEEAVPLKLKPVEPSPEEEKPKAPGIPEKPPVDLVAVMLESVWGTTGKTLEIITDDPEMNFNDDERRLLSEAWKPFIPDMPPWAFAVIVTAAILGKKGEIWYTKKAAKDKAKKEKSKGKPEAPGAPKGEKIEGKPEAPGKGEEEHGGIQV